MGFIQGIDSMGTMNYGASNFVKTTEPLSSPLTNFIKLSFSKKSQYYIKLLKSKMNLFLTFLLIFSMSINKRVSIYIWQICLVFSYKN